MFDDNFIKNHPIIPGRISEAKDPEKVRAEKNKKEAIMDLIRRLERANSPDQSDQRERFHTRLVELAGGEEKLIDYRITPELIDSLMNPPQEAE